MKRRTQQSQLVRLGLFVIEVGFTVLVLLGVIVGGAVASDYVFRTVFGGEHLFLVSCCGMGLFATVVYGMHHLFNQVFHMTKRYHRVR